jgi:hypothetical protein
VVRHAGAAAAAYRPGETEKAGLAWGTGGRPVDVADVRLEVPDGWGTRAQVVDAGDGPRRNGHLESNRLALTAMREGDLDSRRYELTTRERRYGVDVEPVRLGAPGSSGLTDEATCVAEAFLIRPASPQVHVIEANLIRTLRYGYVPGVQEDVLPALARFELDISVLAEEELSYADLATYHAIMVGPNGCRGRGRWGLITRVLCGRRRTG